MPRARARRARVRPATSFLGAYVERHFPDPLDAALQPIARRELGDAGRRAGRDEIAGAQCQHAGEEADVVAHAADHVLGMRGHHVPAVQLDVDARVLRLGQLVPRHDPRPERAEGVEAFADVARVLAIAAPGLALADVPADGVAEDVVERLRFADVARA